MWILDPLLVVDWFESRIELLKPRRDADAAVVNHREALVARPAVPETVRVRCTVRPVQRVVHHDLRVAQPPCFHQVVTRASAVALVNAGELRDQVPLTTRLVGPASAVHVRMKHVPAEVVRLCILIVVALKERDVVLCPRRFVHRAATVARAVPQQRRERRRIEQREGRWRYYGHRCWHQHR